MQVEFYRSTCERNNYSFQAFRIVTFFFLRTVIFISFDSFLGELRPTGTDFAECKLLRGSTIPAKRLTFLTGAKVFQETGKRRDAPHRKNTRLELLCNNANCRLKGETIISWILLQGNVSLWQLDWSLFFFFFFFFLFNIILFRKWEILVAFFCSVLEKKYSFANVRC